MVSLHVSLTQSPAGSAIRSGLPDGPYGWSYIMVLMQFSVLQLHFLFLWKAIWSKASQDQPSLGCFSVTGSLQFVSTPEQTWHLRCFQQLAFRLHLYKFKCRWTYVMEINFSEFPYKAEATGQHSWPCHKSALCPVYTHKKHKSCSSAVASVWKDT